jgi:hypothetical protein
MAWNDDSWKDGYDAWKTREPDYGDDEPEDDCYHEDYEADILTGRATCNRCGHAWWQTKEELEAEQRREAEYQIWVEEQHRRERWEWLARPWRWFWYRALLPFSPRKAVSVLRDDEIPF